MLSPVLDEHASARISSNTSIGKPLGLADVLSISGGIAPINTALAPHLSPCQADIAADFALACRMTNMNRVLQVKLLDEFREIIGVGVQVIALPRLARAATNPQGTK